MKRTELTRKTPLARGKALARKGTALARRSLPRAKPKPSRAPAEVRAARLWWEAVTGRGKKPCVKCGSAWHVQAHHWSRQQDVRRACRTLGLDPADWLWQTANGGCVCESCHAAHTAATERLPRRLVPPQAWEFARRLGIDHLLERYYPEVQ